MKSKIIKELVLASYTNGNLDTEKVEKIAHMLNRALLKMYIRTLKNHESFMSVSVDSAFELDDVTKDELIGLFPDKNITYNTDPSLISGIKITKDDILYEMSIRGTLDEIMEKIKQDYD